MKNTMLLCTTFVALIASMGAHAADTAELKVAGTVRPGACELSIGGGGVIDYGNIPPSTLNMNSPTLLAEKRTTFSIICDAPVKTSVRMIDNRASSVPPGSGGFGLGKVSSKNIGDYGIVIRNVQVDGAGLYYLRSRTNGGPWLAQSYNSDGANFSASGNNEISWNYGSIDNSAPQAFRTVTGTLIIRVAIDKLSNLPTVGEIPLDGSATMELRYL